MVIDAVRCALVLSVTLIVTVPAGAPARTVAVTDEPVVVPVPGEPKYTSAGLDEITLYGPVPPEMVKFRFCCIEGTTVTAFGVIASCGGKAVTVSVAVFVAPTESTIFSVIVDAGIVEGTVTLNVSPLSATCTGLGVIPALSETIVYPGTPPVIAKVAVEPAISVIAEGTTTRAGGACTVIVTEAVPPMESRTVISTDVAALLAGMVTLKVPPLAVIILGTGITVGLLENTV
jgi:hypothetical protein